MSSTISATSRAFFTGLLLLLGACASGRDLNSLETAVLRHEQLAFPTSIVLPLGQDFVTPKISARAPFFEALISWNARVPNDSGMTAELRVRTADDREWSPWLFVGEWGKVPDELERTIEFEDGRIDVDYFTGDVEFDAIQARFNGHGNGAIEIERIDFCLTGASEIAVVDNAEPMERSATSLDVPKRSQRTEDERIADRICSPTSVAMVMEYRGVSESTSRVAERLYDERNDIYGNWTRAIQGAFEFGVPGYLARFSDWESAEAMLASEQPLVVSIRTPETGLTGAPYVSTAGHLLVIVGFDETGNVIVNDPAAENAAEVRRVYSRSEMQQAWMGKGGVAYVFLPRE